MVLVRSQMASYPAPFPSRVKVPFPSSPFCVLFWNHSAHAEVCLSASLCSYVIMLVALGYREVFACVCAKSLQSCLTLCDPMDCNPPGFSVHGILQARVGCVSLLQRIFPIQGLSLLCLLHWEAGSLPLVPPGKPYIWINTPYLLLSFCLTSLCKMGSRFIHLTRTDSYSFLFNGPCFNQVLIAEFWDLHVFWIIVLY